MKESEESFLTVYQKTRHKRRSALLDEIKVMMLRAQVEDYKLHSRLTIFDIEKEDFGMYKCVSKNSLGETESTLRLYGE